MELTREQAIAEHRNMWNWIADKLEEAESDGFLRYNSLYDLKREYVKVVKGEEEYVQNYCYCCEYTKENCNNCPILWGCENTEPDYFCERGLEYSEYNFYDDAYDEFGLWLLAYKLTQYRRYAEAAEVAREIANLPERED